MDCGRLASSFGISKKSFHANNAHLSCGVQSAPANGTHSMHLSYSVASSFGNHKKPFHVGSPGSSGCVLNLHRLSHRPTPPTHPPTYLPTHPPTCLHSQTYRRVCTRMVQVWIAPVARPRPCDGACIGLEDCEVEGTAARGTHGTHGTLYTVYTPYTW